VAIAPTPAGEPFAQKLNFVLKALSLSRGALAAEIGLDKSVVGKWIAGAVTPSPNNLARLSRLVAQRVEGFSVLDWERSISSLGGLLGRAPASDKVEVSPDSVDTLPLNLLDQARDTAARRGAAYEGFFRTVRPYAQYPGRFLHDYVMLRLAPNGQLSFRMVCDDVWVEGWAILLQNQIFVVSTEMTSGAFAYAILNGVNSSKAGQLDGLLLYCALDVTRTPTATAVLMTRIEDLSGDEAQDDARFAEMATWSPVAQPEALSADVVSHLTRDIGPKELALGGDWLLNLPLSRSRSGGLGPTARHDGL